MLAKPICYDCWESRNPDGKARRLEVGGAELCFSCGEVTHSGIYVRGDSYPGDRLMVTTIITKRGALIDVAFELTYTEPPGVELPDVWLTFRAKSGTGLVTSLPIDLTTAEALASGIILACRKAAREHLKHWGPPSDVLFAEETRQTLTRLSDDAPQETEKENDPTQEQ